VSTGEEERWLLEVILARWSACPHGGATVPELEHQFF